MSVSGTSLNLSDPLICVAPTETSFGSRKRFHLPRLASGLLWMFLFDLKSTSLDICLLFSSMQHCTLSAWDVAPMGLEPGAFKEAAGTNVLAVCDQSM